MICSVERNTHSHQPNMHKELIGCQVNIYNMKIERNYSKMFFFFNPILFINNHGFKRVGKLFKTECDHFLVFLGLHSIQNRPMKMIYLMFDLIFGWFLTYAYFDYEANRMLGHGLQNTSWKYCLFGLKSFIWPCEYTIQEHTFEFSCYSSLAGSKAKVGSKKHFVSILDLFVMQHIPYVL